MRRRLLLTLATLLATQSGIAQTRGAGTAPTGMLRSAATSSSQEYRLQSGDVISVWFRFTPEFNEDVTVGPDGHASLKSAGDLRLQGVTVAEARTEIVQGAAGKLVNPEVTVTLKEFDRPHYFVAGEVITPGRQELRRPVTVMEAVLSAGGPKEDSAMGRVVLFRRINGDTSEVHILKLNRYDARTRRANDMLLEPNDLVLVGHDHLETLGRYVKTANLGIYLQPLSSTPVY